MEREQVAVLFLAVGAVILLAVFIRDFIRVMRYKKAEILK